MRLFTTVLLTSLFFIQTVEAHKSYRPRNSPQFSATDAQVADLNYRLNTQVSESPSLYFRDPGSPYDPNSIFNRDYCVATPSDPACYGNFGIWISTH